MKVTLPSPAISNKERHNMNTREISHQSGGGLRVAIAIVIITQHCNYTAYPITKHNISLQGWEKEYAPSLYLWMSFLSGLMLNLASLAVSSLTSSATWLIPTRLIRFLLHQLSSSEREFGLNFHLFFISNHACMYKKVQLYTYVR